MACPPAPGRILTVGTGKQYARPSLAAAVAQNGDTIHIDAGDYRGDVTTWRANNLTICGIGGRARLFADGANAQGKGIWVVAASDSATTTIHSIAFHDARVPDKNGAGIRLDGGSLVIRDCGFYDNEDGILGGDSASTNVTIENSEFARGGYGDGYSHNIYIGNLGRLTVRSSYFHEARIGHNLKSRARETIIENSYFADGPTGTASYQIDTPNGGVVVLRGNLIHKGPNADNSTAINFGSEGMWYPANTLTLEHNTIVTTYNGGRFVYVQSGTQEVRFTANIFAGTNGTTLIGGYPQSSVIQANNFSTTAGNFPNASNVAAPNFWPSATIRPQLTINSVPVPAYTRDAPQPYALRDITGTTRMIGALQAAP
jgi:hypothetical protein